MAAHLSCVCGKVLKWLKGNKKLSWNETCCLLVFYLSGCNIFLQSDSAAASWVRLLWLSPGSFSCFWPQKKYFWMLLSLWSHNNHILTCCSLQWVLMLDLQALQWAEVDRGPKSPLLCDLWYFVNRFTFIKVLASHSVKHVCAGLCTCFRGRNWPSGSSWESQAPQSDAWLSVASQHFWFNIQRTGQKQLWVGERWWGWCSSDPPLFVKMVLADRGSRQYLLLRPSFCPLFFKMVLADRGCWQYFLLTREKIVMVMADGCKLTVPDMSLQQVTPTWCKNQTFVKATL